MQCRLVGDRCQEEAMCWMPLGLYDDVACQKKDWAVHKKECNKRQRRFITTIQRGFPAIDTMTKLLAHPEACGIIARCYFFGDAGFEENKGLAVFWVLQWMKGGAVEAMLILGQCYTNGAVPNKCTEGVKLLLRASKQKDCRHAQHRLGWCYFSGEGVRINKREAAKWFRLAAEGGHDEAQGQLGVMLATGDGVPKDRAEAGIWYRKAAEQGHAPSQTDLGMFLIHRIVMSGRYPIGAGAPGAQEAVEWFRKGAAQGSVDAEHYLGKCLVDGTGVAKDEAEGVRLYRKNAARGYAPSQCYLAKCYIAGTGVVPDLNEARRLFRLSAATNRPSSS
eukprot:TRINITY_DN3437_c0_g1_i9.p1 TRINITY_DN3437_c0_g1~~TRINITY_DN3437_c0_g1_i9.p1  ORF type:complete len:334 (+),score=42.76 TRINITY_DN3437_c0_g1_i9:145-1146(+)